MEPPRGTPVNYPFLVELEAQARRIAAAVKDAGGRALCVGGFVRDRILERGSKHVSIEFRVTVFDD